jgi:hypothetical protein
MMKKLVSAFLFLLFSFYSESRIEGTLSQLFLMQDRARLELIVHADDLKKITGLDTAETDKVTDILQKAELQRKGISDHLTAHIAINTGGRKIPMQFNSCRFEKPFYFLFVLEWVWDPPPDSFEFVYNFENNFDKKDETVLILHDQRQNPEMLSATLLHNARKKAVWNSHSFTSENVILYPKAIFHRQAWFLILLLFITYIAGTDYKRIFHHARH